MLQLKTLPKTPTTGMSPLRVLLVLWALLCLGRGNVPGVQEEIFTRPGSDLLLPIRLHLTLNRTDNKSCDQIEWKYKKFPRQNETRIVRHKGCILNTTNPIPNTRTSENGSLIIHNVTLDNDGIYSAVIHKSTGSLILSDDYTVHVEVPVSVPVLNVSCLRNGSAEISCRVKEGTNPNISLSVIGGSPGNYSASSNNITAIVGSPGPWNITCSVENRVSRNMSRTDVTCPVPLSDIAVTSSCHQNGSAVVVCSVNGSDPRYSWRLDEESKSNGSSVTLPPPVISRTLRCDVTNQINNLSTSINISCTVPVSVPVLNVTCLQNGSSEISCKVEEGTDFSIFLTVIGGSEGYNVSSSERTVHVTVPPVSPPYPWNINCSVKNNISERSTNEIREPCLAPLSTPHVNVSCHTDGSASVSCVLEEDRDVTYTWTVNEESHGGRSRNITISPGEFCSGPLIVSCSVYRKESNKTQIYCPGQNSTCLNCLQKSLIGGTVALMVTMPPLFIAHWYILRGMNKKSKATGPGGAIHRP